MKYFSEQNLDTKDRYKWIPKEHFRGMQGFDQKLLSYVKEVIPVTDKLEDSETIETVSITEEELRSNKWKIT